MLAQTYCSYYCIADKSLSTSTCTVNKKSLSQILVIGLHDSIRYAQGSYSEHEDEDPPAKDGTERPRVETPVGQGSPKK